MTSQNQTPSQKTQKASDWWRNLSSEDKKAHQDKFQNKNTPTSEELVKAYDESQGSQAS